MSKKGIIIVIGLMTAALIGLAVLQIYWIGWSIELNEDQFNKNIYAALSRVSDRIEREEVDQALSILNNSSEVITNDSSSINTIGNNVHYSIENSFEKYLSSDTVSYLGKEFLRMYSTTHCSDPNCKTCKFKRKKALLDFIALKNEIIPRPVTDRIHLPSMDMILRQELERTGINGKFHYGVFDNELNNFVIRDNHYLFSEGTAALSKVGGDDPLETSKYKVGLFPDSKITGTPPAYLYVDFPGKRGLVWASVWKTLLSSILYIGVILFCFIYTIRVIFKQKKVSEMKSDFINNMTHEFKTPIATISLAADSINNPTVISAPDKIKKFIGIIKQENKRMNNQVEKVLQMAQLDRSEYKLKLVHLNIHELIEQAVQNFGLVVEPRGGQIITELKALNPYIEADQTHLSNILHNLMDNANKYSPENPVITLKTRNVKNGVEITVTDNGIGISKEDKRYIFDKFYRVHTGNLHDVKGFGLGLTYVRNMVSAHKGSIELKSEVGKGSSFILTFPFKVDVVREEQQTKS